MKSLITIAAFGLVCSSALAGSTTLSTPTGPVKASIVVLGHDDPTITDMGFAPGQDFDAVVTIRNLSSDRVSLAMPFLGVRYPSQGNIVQRQPWSFSASIAIEAGGTFTERLHASVPRDADVGSYLRVGFVIGLAGSLDDLRRAFDSIWVVRGVTDDTGGVVGTIFGSGHAPLRRIGGNGDDSNQAPAPRRAADPSLPTRRRR